ncbi:MAG: diaminopimelate epimerase [Robiginitomaculum sp.]
MKFYTMNGAGNRFAIFDARGSGFAMSETLAKAVGAPGGPMGAKGCDQIIVLMDPPIDDGSADVFMDIWNNDGSHVDACGNAARCTGWLLMEERNQNQITIQTAVGLLKSKRVSHLQVAVDMGEPLLEWDQIPLKEYMGTIVIDVKVGPIDDPVLARPGAVNMGNPHCVFFVDDVMETAVETLGPMLEFHPLFPQQANIGFAQVIDAGHMRLRVWERGAGLTAACGTGACAAVVAAVRQSRTGRIVRVDMDGGTLHIDWRESDNHVIMTGPVELEGSGDLPV